MVVVCGQVNGKHINLVGQRRGRRACLLWTALVHFDKEAPACHTERAHRRCPRRTTAKHDITNTIKQARALTTFPAYIHVTPLPRRTLSLLCEGHNCCTRIHNTFAPYVRYTYPGYQT